MSCERCGARCIGDRCQHCERFENREHAGLGTHVHFECPDCGGRTSGQDVTCADCRRTA